MLQTPISKWKYIGVLEWGHNNSSTTDFFMAELELVIVNGLEMYPIYAKLEKIVLAIEDNYLGTASDGTVIAANVRNIKLQGAKLVKIFNDSYEKMSTADYNPDINFPHLYDGRNFQQNIDLILTALIIYKNGYMTITELSSTMDLFKKFTMKTVSIDGTITKANDAIMISEHGLLDRLIQSMRYINKVISPSFIRDWCLKTCRHLKCSAHHF